MSEKYRMSREQFEKLEKRLEYLQTVRTREVAEQLKEARSYGDLSENSEYDAAKNESQRLDSEIRELQIQIANAEIVERSSDHNGGISINSTVTVRDVEFGDEVVFQIVGGLEANPAGGRISDDSPLGRGLIGHHAGDTVTVEAPMGEIRYTILKVE